jgi:hypothetical protein
MIELIKEIIEQDGLAKKNRKREIIHRRIYLFEALRKDGHTLKRIGDLFNMHHASILHGLRTYQNLIDTKDKQLKLDTEYYELLLKNNKPNIDLLSEIREAKNLNDLKIIQQRLTNELY